MEIATPVNLIILKKDKILLIKRAENEDSHKGKWSVPGGGLEEGETQEEALRREINEELASEILWFKPFRSFEYQMPKRLVKATYFYGDIKGDIKLSEEHSEFNWFSFKEIKNLDVAYNQKEILKEFNLFIHNSLLK